jgi:branched-chain amino acid transport system substrate-binding protein
MGAEAEGIISAAHFAEGADNAVTKTFVAEYDKRYGNIPSLYGFSMYSGTMWVAKALEKINGRAEDRAALLEAVRSTELDNSPLGRAVKLDDYGNPIYDIYIRKVVKRPDGKLWNVPIATYPNVSQFWTWTPAEYLKGPAYSRDMQYIKKA